MMNVRKKEGRSMKRNNYLPATREPEFKGSLSLLTFSICQTSRHKYRQREREGTWGWGTASYSKKLLAALLRSSNPASRNSPGRQERDYAYWMIQVSLTLECSPQLSMSHCCPCQVPPHLAAAPLSCKCLHLLRGLLFTQPTPSPPQGLKLDATSYKKPS